MCCNALPLFGGSTEKAFIVGMVGGFKVGMSPGDFAPVELCTKHRLMFAKAAGNHDGVPSNGTEGDVKR